DARGCVFSFGQATASGSKCLGVACSSHGVPWHQLVALRGSFGVSDGDLSNRHDYFLGGFQQGNVVQAVITPANAPVRILRGFTKDAFHGTAYVLGTGQGRLPTWTIEQRAWRPPVSLARPHAAA